MRPQLLVRRVVLVLGACTVAAVLGCSKDPARPDYVNAVFVNVVMSGVLRDTTGATTGTRVVSDASGIRVDLLRSGAIVRTDSTIGGRAFFLLEPGSEGPGYQLQARTGPTLSVASEPFTLTAFATVTANPLQLASTGNLIAAPNPFSTTMTARFTVASGDTIGLRVFSRFNLSVRTLVAGSSLGAGTHVITWDGTDDAGQPVADGPYWIALSGDGHEWAELVFKGP